MRRSRLRGIIVFVHMQRRNKRREKRIQSVRSRTVVDLDGYGEMLPLLGPRASWEEIEKTDPRPRAMLH